MNRKKPPITGGAQYSVDEFFAGTTNSRAIRVSFELDDHGWNKLQQSDAWRHFLEALASLQKV